MYHENVISCQVSTKVTVNDIFANTKSSFSFNIPDHRSGKVSITQIPLFYILLVIIGQKIKTIHLHLANTFSVICGFSICGFHSSLLSLSLSIPQPLFLSLSLSRLPRLTQIHKCYLMCKPICFALNKLMVVFI